MNQGPLEPSDRRKLRKQLRPAILFSVLLITLITGVNLAFHYMDVLTGVESVERPPILRLVIIEVLAVVIGIAVLFVLSYRVMSDLINGTKRIHSSPIIRKLIKRENGGIQHYLQLPFGQLIAVDRPRYDSVQEGGIINYTESPKARILLDLEFVQR